MNVLALVEQNTILRVPVGSTIHGLHHEGLDDRDELGIFVEPPEFLIGHLKVERAVRCTVCDGHGLRTVAQRVEPDGGYEQVPCDRCLEGFLYRREAFETVVERTQPEGHRSGPGDLDRVSHSLRKFAKLALTGNPSAMLPFFVPEAYVLHYAPLGLRLRENVDLFLSKRVGEAFIHYLASQEACLTGARKPKTKRNELIARYGYDTKYAMHTLRLGLQGIQLLTTGRLSLPMSEPERARVFAVRNGELSLERVLRDVEEVKERLASAARLTHLPDEPDYAAVDAFLVDAYLEHWERRKASAALERLTEILVNAEVPSPEEVKTLAEQLKD